MNFFAGTVFAACDTSEVPLYGLMIGIGTVLSLIICMRLARQRGYYKDLIFDMLICCLPLAILGARLYYVIFDVAANGTTWTFGEFFGFKNGSFVGLSGLAIYGGVIGIAIGLCICLFAVQRRKPKEKQVSLLQMLDVTFSIFMLGQAFGRWGNFFNQEAYGNYVGQKSWFPFAVHITDPKGAGEQPGWYLATFFYEFIWNLVGAALLTWMYAGKRKSFDGFGISMYCIFYGAGRVWIEGLRTDSLYMWNGGPRVSQVLSGILIAFGLIMILIHVYRARKHNKKIFILVPESQLSLDYLDYDKSMLYRRTLIVEPIEEPEEEVEDGDKYWEPDGEGFFEEESLAEKYGLDSDAPLQSPAAQDEDVPDEGEDA